MDNEFDAFVRQAQTTRLSKMEEESCEKRIFGEMRKKPVRSLKDTCLSEHMTPFTPVQIKAAAALRLTAEESTRAEKTVHAFMEEHPVNMAKAVLKKEQSSHASVWSSVFSLRFGPAFAAVMILVLGGGSLSYAAESALPGDPLYGIKIHVNEEVRATVAISTQAKAEWEADRATRRIGEAEQLAAEGKLTPDTNAALMVAFTTHLQASQKNIQVIADGGDIAEANAINQHTEEQLRDHASTLTTLAGKEENTVVHQDIAAVLHTVEHATDATIAFDGSMKGQIAMNQMAVPMMAMNAQNSDTTSPSADFVAPSFAAARTFIALDAPSTTLSSTESATDPQMPIMHTMGLMKRAGSGASSNTSSGSGSSSIRNRSASSATNTQSSSGVQTDLPIDAESESDATVKIQTAPDATISH
jgi:hypothetical protein